MSGDAKRWSAAMCEGRLATAVILRGTEADVMRAGQGGKITLAASEAACGDKSRQYACTALGWWGFWVFPFLPPSASGGLW